MDRKMTPKQIDYETRRAKAANMTLEQWLRKKSAAETAAKAPPPPAKKPGLLGRLINRGHQPLKPESKPKSKA